MAVAAIWEMKSMSVFDLLLINLSLCLRLEMSPFFHKHFFKSLTTCHSNLLRTRSLSTNTPVLWLFLFSANLAFLSRDCNFQEACTHSPHLLAFHFLPCDVLIEARATYYPLVLFSQIVLWPKSPLVSSLISWCESLFPGRVGYGKSSLKDASISRD